MCILSYILYIYFEINVFKAQMGYGGTQKCKNKMISEGFKTIYFTLKCSIRHWGHIEMLYFQCFRYFFSYIYLNVQLE